MRITFQHTMPACLIAVLIAVSLHVQQKTQRPSDLEKILGAGVDTYPCGDIQFSDTVKEVEKNIIAFLHYDEGNLVAIEVKPTCKYSEAHMPKGAGYPLMSEGTFRRVMSSLGEISPIGRKVEGAIVSPVSSSLKWTTDKYEKAAVEVWNYNCEKPRRGFGCGIRKFVVYYTNGGI